MIVSRRTLLLRGALLLVLLTATGLRFFNLATQSLWHDEGNTARLVERSIPLIIEGAAGDIHPPGYYLLLHGWRALIGEREFALRAYSAFCGVLTVAVAAALGRRVGGLPVALGAAVMGAVHPLAIYYSQEARMYAQLGLVSALTLLAAVVLVERHARWPRRWGAALHLALWVAVGLYTQYAYVFALVGLNLAFGLAWLVRWFDRRRSHAVEPWRLLLHWGGAHLLGGLLFAPWAPIAMGAAGWRPPDLNRGAALRALGQTLLAGITYPGTLAPGYVIMAGFLLAGALFVALRLSRAARFALWAALGMALVPAALIALLGIYRPAYLKFLMASVAPLVVVLASPLCRKVETFRDTILPGEPSLLYSVMRGVALLAILALLVAQVAAVRHLYRDPAFARDDYRGIAQRVKREGRDGDAVLLSAPNQWEVFTYYYRGPLPVYPAPYRPTGAEAEDWVAEILDNHRDGRLFVLYWGDQESDPSRQLERALANNAFKAGEAWIDTVRLARYGTGVPVTQPGVPLDVRAGESLLLDGYHLPHGPWHGGDIVSLTLIWRADAAPGVRAKVFVHLVDGQGSLVAQVDMEPQAGFSPTTSWASGVPVVDRYGLPLPPDIPGGDYTVMVGMYTFDGVRLPITQQGVVIGDVLPLTSILVH